MVDTTSVQGGSAVKLYREGATAGTSPDVQYTRPHTASALTLDTWTMTVAGAASRVAADEARTSLTFSNCGSAIAYMRPDSTVPTSAAFYVQLNPGETYEAVDGLRELAWSVAGSAGSSGNLLIWKGTVP